jgi:hypothetical protein
VIDLANSKVALHTHADIDGSSPGQRCQPGDQVADDRSIGAEVVNDDVRCPVVAQVPLIRVGAALDTAWPGRSSDCADLNIDATYIPVVRARRPAADHRHMVDPSLTIRRYAVCRAVFCRLTTAVASAGVQRLGQTVGESGLVTVAAVDGYPQALSSGGRHDHISDRGHDRTLPRDCGQRVRAHGPACAIISGSLSAQSPP